MFPCPVKSNAFIIDHKMEDIWCQPLVMRPLEFPTQEQVSSIDMYFSQVA